MNLQNTSPEKRKLSITGRIFLFSLVALLLFSCQKELVTPDHAHTIPSATIKNLQVSASNVILLQGNENLKAINLQWYPGTVSNGINYTVEAAQYGTGFADFIEIATTDQASISLTVKELDRMMCQLIAAGGSGKVELRLRIFTGKTAPVYSNPTALQVTTYQPVTEYDIPQYMHIPGNYQKWDLTDAPHIVTTANNGEYEGYINFTDPYAQFLMVKDVTWNPINTYTYIGSGKFGFGGSVFSIFGGAGIYQLKVNTNTNTWNYTKINTWGIHGTAVTAATEKDPEMEYDEATMSWTIKLDLVKGDFRIRANNSDHISFGKTMADGYMVPDYGGANFIIDKPGNYTIILNLRLAGNYACSVIKNEIIQG